MAKGNATYPSKIRGTEQPKVNKLADISRTQEVPSPPVLSSLQVLHSQLANAHEEMRELYVKLSPVRCEAEEGASNGIDLDGSCPLDREILDAIRSAEALTNLIRSTRHQLCI